MRLASADLSLSQDESIWRFASKQEKWRWCVQVSRQHQRI